MGKATKYNDQSKRVDIALEKNGVKQSRLENRSVNEVGKFQHLEKEHSRKKDLSQTR